MMTIMKNHAHEDEKNPHVDYADGPTRKLKSAKMKGKEASLEATCSSSPIARMKRFPLGSDGDCAHMHSQMKASHPHLFTRFPYRPSLMTLLRRVETRPADEVGHKSVGNDPALVYASFQQHWSPAVNLPVLSIVGACNTNISPPHFRRLNYEYGNISVLASTTFQQEYVEFNIPLISDKHDANKMIVMEATTAYDVADQYTSYVLHPQDLSKPIAMIKLWNLSRHGCTRVHDKSLYVPPRSKKTDELHVLGMSGARTTTFKINFPYCEGYEMMMLEELDLQAIGFRCKAERKSNKPYFDDGEEDNNIFGTLPDRTDSLMMPRMTPQAATYRHIRARHAIMVPERKVYFRGRAQYKPVFYPPPQRHMFHFNGTTTPMLFPAGFRVTRDLPVSPHVSLQNVINELAVVNNRDYDDAAMSLADHLGVSAAEVADAHLINFGDFMKNLEKDIKTDPSFPYVVRPWMSTIMPPSWIHSTKHPGVAHYEFVVHFVKEEIVFDTHAYVSCVDTSQTYLSCTEETVVRTVPEPLMQMIRDQHWIPKDKELSEHDSWANSDSDTQMKEPNVSEDEESSTPEDAVTEAEIKEYLASVNETPKRKTLPRRRVSVRRRFQQRKRGPLKPGTDVAGPASEADEPKTNDDEGEDVRLDSPIEEEDNEGEEKSIHTTVEEAAINAIIAADPDIIESFETFLVKSGHPL